MLHRPESWKALRAMARLRGVRIFAKAASVQRIAELDKEINDLVIDAKALTDLAESEERELTDDEQKQLLAITDEDSGKLYALKAERSKVEKLIAAKKKIALEIDAAGGHRDPLDDSQPGEPQNRLPRNIRVVNRLRNFDGQDAARDAYDSGMYLRARIGQFRGERDEKAEEVLEARGHRVIQGTHTEGTDAAGGFLVPDPLERAIIDVRERHSILRPLCRVLPMTAKSVDINKRAGGLTVYYPGESEKYTASDKAWSQFTMTAVKRGVFTKLSYELRDDALINVVDDLVSEFGTAMGLNEDREIVNGDGLAASGGVTGLVPALDAAGKEVSSANAWSGLTMEDFAKTMARYPDRFAGFEPVWLVSRAFYYSVMLPLLVEAAGNTIASLEAGAASGPTFLGHRVVFTEQMPRASAADSTVALFGSFSQAVIIADRMGVQIGQSDQFLFDEDVLCLKAGARYDIKVHEAGGSGAAGAYVGLVTAA